MTVDALQSLDEQIRAKKRELREVQSQISALQVMGRGIEKELDALVAQKNNLESRNMSVNQS